MLPGHAHRPAAQAGRDRPIDWVVSALFKIAVLPIFLRKHATSGPCHRSRPRHEAGRSAGFSIPFDPGWHCLSQSDVLPFQKPYRQVAERRRRPTFSHLPSGLPEPAGSTASALVLRPAPTPDRPMCELARPAPTRPCSPGRIDDGVLRWTEKDRALQTFFSRVHFSFREGGGKGRAERGKPSPEARPSALMITLARCMPASTAVGVCCACSMVSRAGACSSRRKVLPR